VGYEIAQVSGM